MYITRSRKKRIHHLTTITKITKGGGVLTDTYSGKENGTKNRSLPLGHPACVDSKYENGGCHRHTRTLHLLHGNRHRHTQEISTVG